MTAPVGLPPAQGLYDPANEHDACGVGFIAHIKGRKSHAIVRRGAEILCRLTHRGAVGADPKDGDGAGIMIQIPDAYYRAVADCTLPEAGEYATAIVFLPKDAARRESCEAAFDAAMAKTGLKTLGWRDVPTDLTGRLLLLDAERAIIEAPDVSAVMGSELGWSAEQQEGELQRFRAMASNYLPRADRFRVDGAGLNPPSGGATLGAPHE